MKKIDKVRLIFMVFISTSLGLFAQNNLPLKFQEDVAKWSELCWMDGRSIHDQDFVVAHPPVIVDDTLYLFMNYNQSTRNEDEPTWGLCGYNIKKINMQTGEKYWEIKRYYSGYGERKQIASPSFENGLLNVALYRESPPYTGTVWSPNTYPESLTIDRYTGLVVDSNYVDRDDSLMLKLRRPDNGNYTSLRYDPSLKRTSDGYQYRALWAGEGIRTLNAINLDLDGHFVSSDTIVLPSEKYIRLTVYDDLDNDLFGIVTLAYPLDFSDYRLILMRFDEAYNLIDTTDLSRHISNQPVDDIGLYPLVKDYFYIVTDYYNENDSTKKYQYYLFSNQGEFVDSISYTLRPGVDNIIVYGWLHPLIDRVNNRMLVTQSRQEKRSESVYFEIYENSGDTIRPIRRIHVETLGDHFRVIHSFMMDNGDILLYVSQQTPPLEASADRFFSWIMLDGEKMNIVTSTKDEPIVSNKLVLYPNPASQTVHIDHLDSPARVGVYSIEGRMMDLQQDVTDEVDIRHLPAGMYIFDVRSKEVSERHKVVKY